MRLLNKTRWNSRELSSLCKTGLKEKGVDHREYYVALTYSRAKRDRGYARAHGCEDGLGNDDLALHGYAYLQPMWWVYIEGRKVMLKGRKFIRMYVSKEAFDLKRFAQIFEHEIGHTRGLVHKDMLPSRSLTPKWHEGFALTPPAL